jgi:alpha-methylacyl-CoA racemase
VTGPLHGVRVLELASLAPGPFAGTMLSDLGAEVLRLDRPERLADPGTAPPAPLGRGRRSVAVDLKHARAAELVLRLVERADVLVEGFRPGVCERLGIGPEPCLERNPRLVYARFTGWGQTGPLAQSAGHDIDYLAVSGALEPIGPAGQPPLPPLNYLADFAGGGMLGVVGILSALLERERSGRGQVVDVAMVDGAALLTSFLHGLLADGRWPAPRGRNLLDGGAPFYRTYECADGRYVAVGAVEPAFYAALLDGLGLDAATLPGQLDPSGWPRLHQLFAEAFAGRTRDEWAEVFDGTDACVAPVLTPHEATRHPQAVERQAFVDVAGLVQPAPAPRLSRTPGEVRGPAPAAGQHTVEALRDWGVDSVEIAGLTSDVVVFPTNS